MKKIICFTITMVGIFGLFIFLNVSFVYAENNNDVDKSDVTSDIPVRIIENSSSKGEMGQNNKTSFSPISNERSVNSEAVSGSSDENDDFLMDCCEAGTCSCN